MYITFRNGSENEKLIVLVENQKYIINPGEYTHVFCSSNITEFIAETAAFDELKEAAEEIGSDPEKKSFKDKIFTKLAKKFVEKMPEMVLNISVKYEVTCNESQNAVVNLFGGTYSVCDGKAADFFELVPVGYVFVRAETDSGCIRVADARAVNRKQYLRLVRNFLLFVNWKFIFLDLFCFIPEYFVNRFYSSKIYIKMLFAGFYKLPSDKRAEKLAEKECEGEKKEKKGCLSGFIKVLIVFAVLGGICWWAISSEPDVVISADFQSVVCFDEMFVRIDGELPEDAEKVFLEDFFAYYPLADGEYDSDNYYCYIYEDPKGDRYMWLKDGCSKEENEDKEYDDYENPLVYKSTGEVTD